MQYAKLFFIAFLLVFLGACKPKSKEMQNIHIEDLFSISSDKQLDISPDGKYISSVESKNQKTYFCLEIRDSTLNRKYKFTISKNIVEYHWINNTNILYISNLKNKDSNQISILDLKTKKTKVCYSFNGKWKLILPQSTSIKEIILFLPSLLDARLNDAYRLNLETKQFSMDAVNSGCVLEWIYDTKLQLRAAKALSADNHHFEIWYRKNIQSPFDILLTYPFSDEIREICFTNDGENLNLLSNIGKDKLAWVEFNPKTRKELVEWHKHLTVDLDRFIRFSYNPEVLGVAYTDGTDEKYIKNDRLKKVTQSINLFLGHSQWEYINANEKQDKFLIFSSSDVQAGTYYLYNSTFDRCYQIYENAKWLQKADLNPQHYLSIPINKHTTIYAYISFPNGYDKLNAKYLPLLVYIHDGPFLRDKNKYQPDVQFFTKQGYAVLQVNYRPSSGYGKEYRTNADQAWNKIPMQDIINAVNYVISHSWVNSQKIALLGSGFGAMVAQSCIEKAPSLFACAVLDTNSTNYNIKIQKAYTFSDSLGTYFEKQIGYCIEDTLSIKTTEKPDSLTPVLHWQYLQPPHTKKDILNMYLHIEHFLNSHIGILSNEK